jgi:hypothetical protein
MPFPTETQSRILCSKKIKEKSAVKIILTLDDILWGFGAGSQCGESLKE